MTHTNITQKT